MSRAEGEGAAQDLSQGSGGQAEAVAGDEGRRLTQGDAARVSALAVLGLLLLLAGALGRRTQPPEPAWADCPGDQVSRDRLTGALRCDGRGEALSAEELLVLGVPLDVNQASAEALAELPRVGPALAGRIVEGRPYAQLEDLLRVRGLGEKTLDQLRPLLRVVSATRAAPAER